MQANRIELNGLPCVVVDELAPSSHADLAVMLAHGFGAPGDDLVGLGVEILHRAPDLRGRLVFYFPAAPIVLGGMFDGDARAWWEIDLERFNRAVMSGDYRDLCKEEPVGLAPVRARFTALVEGVRDATSLPIERLVLGGFSQGAMLATDVTLRLATTPAALAVFSGTLLIEPQWRALAPARQGLRVLQSHGRDDPLLPFEMAAELHDLLVEAGARIDFIPFRGGHTIPPVALEHFISLLRQV